MTRLHRVVSILTALAAFVVPNVCASASKPMPRLAVTHAWPPAPDTARVQYVGALASGAVPSRAGWGATLRRWLSGGSGNPELRLVRPTDVYAESADRVYVTDAAQSAVFVLDRGRHTMKAMPIAPGGAPAKPMGLTGDGRGRLLVTDPPGRRVVVLEPDGRWVRALGGRGVLLNPVDVAVDTAAQITWVADSHLHQVLAFDASGSLVRTLGRKSGDARSKVVEAQAPANAAERSLADVHRSAAGSRDVRENRGGGPGEFLYPCGVAVSGDGTLYVCDGLNARVQAFSRDGRFLRAFGRLGDVPGTFARPKGIALDQAGRVYVVDAAFNNVQIFEPDGTLLLAFGELGSGPGELRLPLGLWIDRDERIYVADRYNGRIQEFTTIKPGRHEPAAR